jgi:hypothetical protein
MLKQRDSIHLAVGLVAGFLDKCRAIPELQCAVTTLGPTAWQEIIFTAIREAFTSFDDLKAGIEPLLHEIFDYHSDSVTYQGKLGNAADVWIIGWSAQRQAPEGFTIGLCDLAEYEERAKENPDARRPFQIDPLSSLGINFSPCPTGQQLAEARFPTSLAATEELIPEVDLLQLMEVQRRLPYRDDAPWHFIGGYAVLTSVDKSGVTQQRIHEWPDEVGQLIEPGPIDWLRWRAEREAPLASAKVIPLNRQQRRKARR